MPLALAGAPFSLKFHKTEAQEGASNSRRPSEIPCVSVIIGEH